MLEPERRSLFEKALIEQKYKEYQEQEIDDTETIKMLREKICRRNVLLMAPGHSLVDNMQKIRDYREKEHCIVISVSFVPDFVDTDYVFLSNYKRYNTTFNPSLIRNIQLIHTSNIQANSTSSFMVNYSSLLNEEDIIIDNSSLLALNLLTKLNPAKMYLAGLDGYSLEKGNYYAERLNLLHNKENILAQNKAMKNKIAELQKKMTMEFITPSMYSSPD
jgi:4-hydroxy 2-oxovalerate aldolase